MFLFQVRFFDDLVASLYFGEVSIEMSIKGCVQLQIYKYRNKTEKKVNLQ